ncbi:MAG: MFS transporter [Caulobacterales bacterium]|nr:MFS transporter [Caulobacterales bacterium]
MTAIAEANRSFTIALALLAAMSATAVDIVIPVTPTIERAFAVSPASAQLVVTAYIAGMCFGLIPIGAISDRFGRRPVILACVTLFTLFGAAMALSLPFPALLALRFGQGLVGAAGPALSRAIVRDLNLPDSGARLMALITAALSLAPLVGPLLGGLLGDGLGWRAPFWVSAVYGLATVTVLALWMPETRAIRSRSAVVVQLSSAFGMIAASTQSKIAILLFALPFAGYFAILTSLSQVMNDLHDVAPAQFGALFALSAATYFAGAILTRKLLAWMRPERVLRLGMRILGATGFTASALFFWSKPDAWVLWALASAFMFGMAICLPITTMTALAPLARAAGIGASVLGVFQIGIGALGSLASAKLYGGNHLSMCVVIAISAVCASFVHSRYQVALWRSSTN